MQGARCGLTAMKDGDCSERVQPWESRLLRVMPLILAPRADRQWWQCGSAAAVAVVAEVAVQWWQTADGPMARDGLLPFDPLTL